MIRSALTRTAFVSILAGALFIWVLAALPAPAGAQHLQASHAAITFPPGIDRCFVDTVGDPSPAPQPVTMVGVEGVLAMIVQSAGICDRRLRAVKTKPDLHRTDAGLARYLAELTRITTLAAKARTAPDNPSADQNHAKQWARIQARAESLKIVASFLREFIQFTLAQPGAAIAYGGGAEACLSERRAVFSGGVLEGGAIGMDVVDMTIKPSEVRWPLQSVRLVEIPAATILDNVHIDALCLDKWK